MSKDNKAKPDWREKFEADLDRGLREYDTFGPTRETRLSDEQIIDYVIEVFDAVDVLDSYEILDHFWSTTPVEISHDAPGDTLGTVSNFEHWFCFRVGRSRDHGTFIVPRRVIWKLLKLGSRNPDRQDVLPVLTEMRE